MSIQMAFISDASLQNRFAAGFDRAVTAVVGLLVAISTSQSRVRQIELLCAKTDEELAARGLIRQDIVCHVYRDVYYV
jgi:hypothetical protein